MEYDPFIDRGRDDKHSLLGPLRSLFSILNPFSSRPSLAEMDRTLDDARAREVAEVKAGRPQDDYLMFASSVPRFGRADDVLIRWVMPPTLVLALIRGFLWESLPRPVVLVLGSVFAVLLAVAFVLCGLLLAKMPGRLHKTLPTRGQRDFTEGLALQSKGDLEGAIEHILRAIDKKPDTLAGRVFLANAYADSGRHDTALQVAREAADMFPQHPWPRQLLGDIYKSQGRADDAIRELERAVILADAIDGLDVYKRLAVKAIEEIEKLVHP